MVVCKTILLFSLVLSLGFDQAEQNAISLKIVTIPVTDLIIFLFVLVMFLQNFLHIFFSLFN